MKADMELLEEVARLRRELAAANDLALNRLNELIYKAHELAEAKARAICPGVQHAGCNYLAACNTVCNKCGQIVKP
jgi:hypothetical protein